MTSEYVLEMKNISKSFFKVNVLNSVNLAIKPGEVHALIGENGAGKSTLMKILMGIYEMDEGEILIRGQKVNIHSPREALDLGVAMIHQELNPLLDMEVAENIFLGRELIQFKAGPLSLVNKKEERKQTERLFTKMGININPKSFMRDLSVAQRQLVEIVKAITVSAKVVVMDEPTSAITEREVKTLFEQIQKLKQEDVAIIYISHKMDEIFKIADRITVLRDGNHICTEEANRLDQETLIKMMVGREIKEFFPKTEVQPGPVVLSVKDFCLGKKYSDISFDLRAGEILGIAGLVGAGRSELVESIFGITKPDCGQLLLNGKPIKIKRTGDAISRKIALITEDRKYTGLNLKTSIQHNISLVGLDSLSKWGIVNSRREEIKTQEQIERMNIKVFSQKNLVSSLSGGNQQKVVLAKWLLTQPDIIILDEPTRGIDVGAKRDIYLLMGELVKAGKALLMISSEIPELMGLSDRILVLAAGRLTGELERKDFSQERIMKYASQFKANQNE